MSKQSEAILENQLVAQLQKMGYKSASIKTEQDLINNLKVQLEKHNKIIFSDKEFNAVLNILNKGSIFEKAKSLRQKQHIVRDNGENLYFEFLNSEHWCQNQFQVANQITIKGNYENRYDVTLLINGLPLVQIELKKTGIELKQAFNQVNRYQKHSFGSNSALFQYIQIFVISNGVNTKYFANNKNQSFKQTFYWTDKNNNRLTNILNGFTSDFLEPCQISKMICKYIVLNETFKVPMVLRPYQYYAVESIIDKVKNSSKNGYIWHTTGSGKTLTSFKASQILMNLPEVKKVVFVVDRKDLDYQTTKEFNSFNKGCVDGTENTKSLVQQFEGDNRLIITTIQKLNTAISKKQYSSKMETLKKEKIVFIFDECHRSQFGETHQKITSFFENYQMFGFTGTPIFADNSVKNELGRRTTSELFGECLHKYVITDAIKDENVLRFSVEYVGRYKKKENSASELDIEVEDIDTKELMEHQNRLDKITDYIIANHNRKTHERNFTAMFCVSSVDVLTKYYDIFHEKKQNGKHNLNIATVFSYAQNEEANDADGFIPEELSVVEEPKALYGLSLHSRDKLESYIGHYNQMFDTKFSTKDSESFYNYYNDISKKVRERKIDILLVVNMFLTGFDSPTLNTMYVDKNLRHHGLIQAYSRTNRVLNEQKSQGNIVVFRNLKQATDEAILLFSNKDAIETILMQPYEDYANKFDEAYNHLKNIVPTVDSVNGLFSEEDELEFIKAFRSLMRLLNVLQTFSDFKWDDFAIKEQEFEDYKSKYLDLHDKVKKDTQKEKVSIINDVDFELELIHKDEINVTYILNLLSQLKNNTQENSEKAKSEILNLLRNETELRSKRELIERFIEENLPKLTEDDDISEAFNVFWSKEQESAFDRIVSENKLSATKTKEIIEQYLFSEQQPKYTEMIDLINVEKPIAVQRKLVGNKILNELLRYVDTFMIGYSGRI
jgi:type I restriction enzyme R subunit